LACCSPCSGVSTLLLPLFFGLRSGWTTYAPLDFHPSWFDDLRFFCSLYLHAVFQVISGVLLLVFSRRVGFWLARGIADDEA